VFSFNESLLFFADQAMKGLLFDVSNVFDLHLQSSLHVDARRHPVFGVMYSIVAPMGGKARHVRLIRWLSI
jgi:hypothetical protein